MRLDPALRDDGRRGRARFALWRRVFECEEFWSLLVGGGPEGRLRAVGDVRRGARSCERPRRASSRARRRTRARRGGASRTLRECGARPRAAARRGLPAALLEEYEREIVGPAEDSLTEKHRHGVRLGSASTASSGKRPATGGTTQRGVAQVRSSSAELAGFARLAGASTLRRAPRLRARRVEAARLAGSFEKTARPSEERSSSAHKARALAPPGSEAGASRRARLRALGADEEARERNEAEYAEAVARELSDGRAPKKLFKDDPKGDKTIDSVFKPQQKTRPGVWRPCSSAWRFAFTCFALQ